MPPFYVTLIVLTYFVVWSMSFTSFVSDGLIVNRFFFWALYLQKNLKQLKLAPPVQNCYLVTLYITGDGLVSNLLQGNWYFYLQMNWNLILKFVSIYCPWSVLRVHSCWVVNHCYYIVNSWVWFPFAHFIPRKLKKKTPLVCVSHIRLFERCFVHHGWRVGF